MQVLLATQLRRTPSLACPSLFHFDEHFDFLSVLGRTRLSEVIILPVDAALRSGAMHRCLACMQKGLM